MFDAAMPDREPDAILYAPLGYDAPWGLPWVAAAQTTAIPDE